MTAFFSPTDIKNRALDHLGARRVASAADGSRNSAIMDGLYDKLREAELERNLWTFATARAALRPIDTTTMLFVPAAYSSSTQYLAGDIVSFTSTNGQPGYFIATLSTQGNVAPVDANGAVNSPWDNYFGPQTADAWVSSNASLATTSINNSQAYRAGELAYLAPGNGTVSIFLSLTDQNTDDPLATAAWSSTTTYANQQLVLGSNQTLYESTTALNIGNDPTITVGVAAWVNTTTYAAGAYVSDASNHVWKSLVGSNTGHAPFSSPTFWSDTGMWTGVWSTTITPQPRASSNNWHFLANASLLPLNILYPVGAGPVSQAQTANIFMLPYGYLKQAPTESRKGTVTWLGGPSGVYPDDWVFGDRFIVSGSASPILIRFVRNFQNVALMKNMFCEGLAARMAFDACEVITQSLGKQQVATAAYRGAMGEARTANAIEAGPIDPPVDDYILVRQ